MIATNRKQVHGQNKASKPYALFDPNKKLSKEMPSQQLNQAYHQQQQPQHQVHAHPQPQQCQPLGQHHQNNNNNNNIFHNNNNNINNNQQPLSTVRFLSITVGYCIV